MTTKELINEILRSVPSATRVDIRSELNAALRIIFNKPLEIMRIKDTSTGKDPVLTTTAGVFEYELDAAAIGVDAKYVTRVYQGSETDPDDCDDVSWNVRELTGTNNSVILFEEDPGGAEYFITAYKHHDKIVSETVPAVFPFPEEFIQEHLIALVVGRLEEKYHGKSLRLDEFMGADKTDIGGLRDGLNDRGSNVYYTRNRGY